MPVSSANDFKTPIRFDSPIDLPSSDRSRLRPAPPPGSFPHSAVASSGASLAGSVGGQIRGIIPSVAGRAVPAAPTQPGDALGHAVQRSTNLVVDLVNQIESTRVAGQLSPLGKALLRHVDQVAGAYQLVAGGPVVGEKLATRIAQLKHLLRPGTESPLRAGLAAVLGAEKGAADEKISDKLLNDVSNWTEAVIGQAADRVDYLEQSLRSSPFEAAGIYETKQQVNEAAVAVLDRALQGYHGPIAGRNELRQAKQLFQERREKMGVAARDLDGAVVDGQPHVAVKKLESELREHYAAALLSQVPSGSGAKPAALGLDTPGCSEMAIVAEALGAVLKNAGVEGNASRLLAHAFGELLNNSPAWSEPVRKDIHFQERSADTLRTHVAHSQITPAAVFMPSYNGKGVNSHESAEATHAVNLAQTQLTDADNNTLFTGVRHGVLSAFSITPAGVRNMDDHELEPLVKSLLPKDQWVLNAVGAQDIKTVLAAVRKEVKSSNPLPRLFRGDKPPLLVNKMRAVANTNRAREVVALTVAGDPALMEAALQGKRPKVNLLSISMLTPDIWRRGEQDNETLMVADQAAAWKSVSGLQTIEVPTPNGGSASVEVDVNPIPVNYGVNEGAVKYGRWDIASGWNISNTLNVPSLRELFGDDLTKIADSRQGVLGAKIGALEKSYTDEAEKNLNAHKQWSMRVGTGPLSRSAASAQAVVWDMDARRLSLESKVSSAKLRMQRDAQDQSTPLGAALELQRQIAALQKSEDYKRQGTEPYKMPTRLAVLGELLGIKIAFNCKSGKDRTGELDAEIKHFKLQMAQTGKVPHYERERSEEEQRQFHEVLTNSGNFEMHRMNTGHAGFKLNGVESLYQQFGGSDPALGGSDSGDELTRNFHGLSTLTAS